MDTLTFDFSILTYSPWPWVVIIGILVMAVVLFVAAENNQQATPVAEPVEVDAEGRQVIEP